ncbi:DUF4142 domain-containing protein [Motilibacter aurantiacus]|uniref:DUF4142 domain-containing protein n=1 Tax=Motilibacter aurantiacus TaxID=2714955 RepID=UPI001408122D|nr:DUF4142 domain-containing protein [Motilibacter aurantiacus]NHC43911.1 DUF4142 domain-containing protein [Motilibacter aurantiacus]
MKTKLLVPAALAAAALTLGSAPALAAPVEHSVSRQATAAEARAMDVAWLKAIAASDLFEIRAGQLAIDKAETIGVAALGAVLVADHRKHLAQVRALARAHNVTLPTKLAPADAAAIEKLAALDGLAFDRNWARKQVSAHRKAILLTGETRMVSRNAAVLDLARKTLPVVKMHRDAALGIWIIIAPAEEITDELDQATARVMSHAGH